MIGPRLETYLGASMYRLKALKARKSMFGLKR